MDDKKVTEFMELAESLVKDLQTTKSQSQDSQRRFQKTEQDLLNQIEALRSQLEACTSELKDTQEGWQKTTAELEKTRAELVPLKQNDTALQETRESLRESNAGLTHARVALEQKEAELEDMRGLVEQMAAENEQLRRVSFVIIFLYCIGESVCKKGEVISAPPGPADATYSCVYYTKARSPSVEIVAVRTISSKDTNNSSSTDTPTTSLKRTQSTKEPSPLEVKRRRVEVMIKKESESEVDKPFQEKTELLETTPLASSTSSQVVQTTRRTLAQHSQPSLPTIIPAQQPQIATASTVQTPHQPQKETDKSTPSPKTPSATSNATHQTMAQPNPTLQNHVAPTAPVIQSSASKTSTSPGINASNPHINTPSTLTTQPVASNSTSQTPATQSVISTRMLSSQSKVAPDVHSSPSPKPKIIIPPRASPTKKESKSTDLKLASSSSTVLKHLSPCQPLPISPAPTAPEVSRRFLTATYGGNPQSFINVLKKNPTGPGTRRIVFPMLDCNPFVPRNPGEPGLIFASRHEILSDPPWTVFVKRTNAAPAVWMYQGEYECTLCGTMTVEEFVSQTQKVQDRWAQEVHDAKTYDVYVIMRARVALRKAGLIPLKDKVEETSLIEEEMQNIKRGKGRVVTLGEILSAFHKGEEAIDIIRMNCVKYDHIFADDMKVQYASYHVSPGKNSSSSLSVVKKKSRSATVPVPRPPSVKSNPGGTGKAREYSRATAPIPTTHSETLSADRDLDLELDPDAGLRRSNRPRSTRVVSPDNWSSASENSDMDYDFDE
ncbi:hypothetical protein JR316_0000152 [Psilocybe cubensis]|uniref:Uncharacterized protein n=1 Tax=Psilocybe cubensis TaxID=181762 RepID=A0ACB8HE58_PSICU|nr:hypothetical protein JR316_0000152 [Psilocybe cubensis]KAH9486088.1 hypothetical protein JR316_0000152 [Psilocybe cubensis]